MTKKVPWANTAQARARAYQAAADILYEATQDSDIFDDEDISPVELRAALFYLDQLVNEIQKKAFSLEDGMRY